MYRLYYCCINYVVYVVILLM